MTSKLHLSDYYPTPAIGVEGCALGSCGILDYQANPPLQRCSRCKYVWYCSKAHSAHWKKHKIVCARVVESSRRIEIGALSDPLFSLLTTNLRNFVDSAGANEILFAGHCAFHLSHPSLPRIDQTHLLRLFVEFDPEASHKSLREQCRFDSYELCPKKEFLADHVARGRGNWRGDTCDRIRPENMRLLGPNHPITGSEDGEYWVEVNGWWKGDHSGEGQVINRPYGVWIARTAPGTEREYEAIVKDWFPFLQETMKGPGRQFRHLFDRKVDIATRLFDFGPLETTQGLPPRDSPGYHDARERIFRDEERWRDMFRQHGSIPHGPGMGPIIGQRSDGSAIAIFTDGPGVVKTELEQGQDLLEPVRKAKKKAKKDQRKRDRKEREAREAREGAEETTEVTEVLGGLSLDG